MFLWERSEKILSELQSKSLATGTKNSMGQKSIYNRKLDLKWYKKKKRFEAILTLVPLYIINIYCFKSLQIKHPSTLA